MAHSTREKIMDAAELQFAEYGYDAVSVRNITDTARVRLGLLAYHFGTKEALFEAVIARRVDELNQRRLAALSEVRKKGDFSVEQVISAFLYPYLELACMDDPGWRAYTKLVAQISHNEHHLPVLKKYLDAVGHQFIDAIMACFPNTSYEQAACGFIFTAAAMVGIFSRPSRINSLSQGKISNEDLQAIYPNLLTYAVAGVTATCSISSPVTA
ncbi:TetR/AcrR family transcriptional regulator [Dickeya oryzae]|uniref:TetR/AcrR family transcriptional regulator n=1 Tax=Dickeya oryzae TaxID=1240404 RepID=UPI0020985607|nr:TetR/AcrR family transcriptional regulator [Dickeya oryzae]MCO7256372.1 TetR/AcrR family transcriptional regulator [Dickeya oryzae]